MKSQLIIQELKSLGNPEIAKTTQRFFKTCQGEYGEGNIFLGIRAGPLRKLARSHKNTPPEILVEVLQSEYHEARLFALYTFVLQFQGGSEKDKKNIFNLYLTNTKFINNWDLVDSSGMQIVGAYLADKDRSILYTLSQSKSLWERRISIFSTFHFIRNNDFEDTLKLANILLHDPEDLIHKVVGWMLREVGKRDLEVGRGFLNEHYKAMPRTMLRYAIEKLDEPERQAYLKGTI